MSFKQRWQEWRGSRAESTIVANEMHFHIEQETRRNIQNGMAPDEARREALRAFGGIDRYMEQSRDERPGSLLDDLAADVPLALSGALRREVLRLNPDLPLYDVLTMEQRVAAATARTRVIGLLLAFFAATALVLALIGIYGLVAYAVTQRTREIGLRIALGAANSDVVALVLPHSALLVGTGLGLGLLGAWSATRVLRSLLFEVEATDPLVFASLTLATLIVALGASALPVLRATRLHPISALRSE